MTDDPELPPNEYENGMDKVRIRLNNIIINNLYT